MDITWTKETETVQKFQGSVPNGPNYECTLTRAADGTITAAMTQNITTNLGSMQIPGDWAGAKAFFSAVGAGL